MKRSLIIWGIIATAAVTGCSQGTPGGPGTTDKAANKPAFGQAEDTFNLSVPMISTSLQQGEKTETQIGIKRAMNFDQDVVLSFGDLPKGVTIEPAEPIVKHGDVEAKVTFHADDDSALGEFKVKVTGHPTKGSDALVDFKLKIAPKDSFTLTTPRLSTSLKQGETKTVSIGIKRDKTFDQDISLMFGDMPTGITLEPMVSIIKPGDEAIQVSLTSADDASLGNFAIKFTGHPAVGADASNELKLNVIKQ
jgi:hypothetical protein